MGFVTERDVKVDLPPRYSTDWRAPFVEEVTARLGTGSVVLDVGSGRNPAVAPELRPESCTYIGLDLSAEELDHAGPGAYDEKIVGDAAALVPSLIGRVDLIISWQVFEHVQDLDVALENLRQYLTPGGSLISLFSGGLSAFAIVSRALPSGLGPKVVERLMRRKGTSAPAFPAYYDHCTARALRGTTTNWSDVQVIPFFRGATYFHFSGLLTKAYLSYEGLVRRIGVDDLATHYMLIATR